MAVSQAARSIILAALFLLAVFLVVSVELANTPPSDEEGVSLWVVRDAGRPPQGFSQSVQAARDGMTTARTRANELARPPLYYVLLDGWTLLAGDSLFAARLPSAWVGLLALALTWRIARQFIGRWQAWLALALLASSPFFIAYTREAWLYAGLWVLVLLPAAALVLVWLITEASRKVDLSHHRYRLGVLLGVIVAAQWLLAPQLLAPRPDWNTAVSVMTAARQPLEPAVMQIDPRSPLAYYLPRLRHGVTLQLGWRELTPDDMRAYAAVMGEVDSLWAVLPAADASSAALLEALAARYTLNRQHDAGGMAFYHLTANP